MSTAKKPSRRHFRRIALSFRREWQPDIPSQNQTKKTTQRDGAHRRARYALPNKEEKVAATHWFSFSPSPAAPIAH